MSFYKCTITQDIPFYIFSEKKDSKEVADEMQTISSEKKRMHAIKYITNIGLSSEWGYNQVKCEEIIKDDVPRGWLFAHLDLIL